jgi:hypothetical protein
MVGRLQKVSGGRVQEAEGGRQDYGRPARLLMLAVEETNWGTALPDCQPAGKRVLTDVPAQPAPVGRHRLLLPALLAVLGGITGRLQQAGGALALLPRGGLQGKGRWDGGATLSNSGTTPREGALARVRRRRQSAAALGCPLDASEACPPARTVSCAPPVTASLTAWAAEATFSFAVSMKPCPCCAILVVTLSFCMMGVAGCLAIGLGVSAGWQQAQPKC